MRLGKISLATFLLLGSPPISAQNLESVFIKGNKLIYQGLEVTRSATPGADSWTITIKKNGVDLDKDGVFEFTQNVMTFDYFPLSHSDSPFPPAIFKYNQRAGKYLPANWLFPSRVAEGIESKLATVAGLNKRPELEKLTSIDAPEYTAASLDVLLRYLYAGQEKMAWDFFDKNYKLSDKQEMKLDIEKKLRDCALYQCLYRRGR